MGVYALKKVSKSGLSHANKCIYTERTGHDTPARSLCLAYCMTTWSSIHILHARPWLLLQLICQCASAFHGLARMRWAPRRQC